MFLRLDDVAEGLPAFDETVVQVPLGALEAPYRALEREVTSAVKAALAQGSKKLLGTMIASLTTWPDHPFDWKPLVQREPRKVIEFPTLVFHQIPLSTFTFRQASRRSWRIGQAEPVRVFYMAYEGTLQSKLLSLMASKISASSALEGSFSEDGLAALAGGEDLTTELARTLAEGIKLQDAGRAWAKVSAGKPKAAKAEVEPRVDPFRQAAVSNRRTVRRRTRRAAQLAALPSFA